MVTYKENEKQQILKVIEILRQKQAIAKGPEKQAIIEAELALLRAAEPRNIGRK